MTYEKYFKEFLGFVNVRNRYVMACAMHGRSMRKILETREPKDWIRLAFNPFTTYEGGDFWGKIGDEWLEWVKAIDKEARL